MNYYPLEIAGLRLMLEAEFPLTLHKYLQPFLKEQFSKPPDYIYHLTNAFPPSQCSEIVFSDSRMTVFSSKGREVRRYTMWDSDPHSPVNPALFPAEDRKYTLYCPPPHQKIYAEACELTPMLALEAVFAQNRRLILHSSVVLYRGEAVLFCAASGVGKSTQAALWKKTFNVEILNGDRCVIEQTESGFIAHGSPYSGSSEICKCKSARIRGIFLLSQARENRIFRLSEMELFRGMFPQIVVNLWNAEQVQTITDMLADLIAKIPIYQLACRPDREAAELAEKTLF